MALFQTEDVDISYYDVGEGSPPMLFLHGYSCSKDDYAEQVKAFSDQHRIIAFDQRGHGESSLAFNGEYGFEQTAADARRLCLELGVERPIVFGHSLGGVSALQLASEPGFASALVLLDSTVELPRQVDGELASYADRLGALSDDDYVEEVRAYAISRMIDPSDDPDRARDLVERTASCPKEVYIGGIRSIAGADVTKLAMSVEVPTLFIASSVPWLPPGRVRELRPTWYLGRTVGAGHFGLLLVPNQVNSMISRFLDSVANGFTSSAPSEW